MIPDHWHPYHHHYPNHHVAGHIRLCPNVWSPQLRNHRQIVVYLPPSYMRGDRRYPVLYMHDGQNIFDPATSFAGEWRTDETMENLAYVEGREAIIVGIPNLGAERFAEYNPFGNGRGKAYIEFISDTLKGMIDRDFRTQPDRDHTGLMGSSLGGIISLFGFFWRGDVFGFVGGMSPSLWLGRGAMYDMVRERGKVPGRVYVDNGQREMSAEGLFNVLQEKGYHPGTEALYVFDPDGEHNEPSWARRLPNALRFLLPLW